MYSFLVWTKKSKLWWQKWPFNDPFADRDNILLSPLHIKFGIIKQLVKDVCKNLLGNNTSANYKNIVEKLMSAMKDLGCKYVHLSSLSAQPLRLVPWKYWWCLWRAVWQIHLDIKVMEEQYQARLDCNMVADYCWSLKQDCPDLVHARKSLRKSFPK